MITFVLNYIHYYISKFVEKMMPNRMVAIKGMLIAFLAAVFYAINTPVSKRLLENVSPTMMAALLYIGAGIVHKHNHKHDTPGDEPGHIHPQTPQGHIHHVRISPTKLMQNIGKKF